MSTNTPAGAWPVFDPFLNAAWDSRLEDAAQIAARLAPTLTALSAATGGSMKWTETHSDAAIDLDDAKGLEAIIAEQVSRGAFGDAFPSSGFELALAGRRESHVASISLFVGSGVSGRHRASNNINVTCASGTCTAQLAETVLLVIATWWQPASIAATDHDTIRLTSGRERFAPHLGQRMWLRDDVGTITTAPDGVRVEPVAGGTLLATDDSWSPQQVVDTLKTTLTENNITTIPRGPQAA